MRTECLRCLRPTTACFCASLPALRTRSRVIILQHPRERRVAIGTARMAHLALPESSLFAGIRFDQDARMQDVLVDDDVAILWPGADAVPAEQRRGKPPRTLIVVDGTWHLAKKVLTVNPRLAALPKIALTPTLPGNYRIRKEPRAECLATIEAIAAALGVLEDDDARFAAMIPAFTQMIDRQIERAAQNTEGPRRWRTKRARGGGLTELLPLRAHLRDAVILYAEANAHPQSAPIEGVPEVLHLLAIRPATGERFEAILRPRRPLSPTAPHHLGLARDALENGEDRAAAFARFRAFLGARATLCTWGPFARDLLVREGEPKRGFVDVRALAARAVGRSAGGIERGAASLGASPAAPWAPGRAGRMIAALAPLLEALIERAVANERLTIALRQGDASASLSA